MSAKNATTANAGLKRFADAVKNRGGSVSRLDGREAIVSVKSPNGERTLAKFKAKSSGGWQGQKGDRHRRKDSVAAWILVDLEPAKGGFYFLPEKEMRAVIDENISVWLKKDPSRKVDDKSHLGITMGEVKKWKDRWDVIGL